MTMDGTPAAPIRPAATALDAWDDAEPHVLRFLLKVALKGALYAATPFFAVALLFLLLAKPASWILAVAGIGCLVLALGFVAFLVLRRRLRRLRAKVEAAREVEAAWHAASSR